MPRIARGLSDGSIFHVINRGNGKNDVFHKEGDYYAFLSVIKEARQFFLVDILAYCLMPNHFHLLLQPQQAAGLSKMMQWLMTCHVRRYHQHYGTCGHVWQGRYKSFLIQEDEHLVTVARYVEGNPVRALLVDSARQWPWSSHVARVTGTDDLITTDLPVGLPENWGQFVDTPMTSSEIEKVRKSVNRQAPYGKELWVDDMSANFGLASTLRPRGRPKK
jgi:putative transposase